VRDAATSLRGAVAETSARTGFVDRSSPARLALATAVESIEVVDLVGPSARWVGATQEIAATPDLAATREWARALHRSFPSLRGLRWRGRQAGSICFVLNERTSIAALRAEDWPISEARLWPRVARAARDCRLAVV
ncbi:MAG: RES domain-containing protein, partial [Acidobacteriota bacterium]